MSRNLKVLITLFSMTALYGVYYWGIPAIIDLPNNIDLIEQAVLKKSGYKISIQNPSLKMGLIPAIKIKADDFAILNDDNSKAFDIEKPYISIRLLPLIFKEIDIHDFSAENIQTNLVFDKDNKLKLGQYVIELPKEKATLKLSHARIHLNSYEINLNDKVQTKKISMNGQYLTIDNFENNNILIFQLLQKFKPARKKLLLSLILI